MSGDKLNLLATSVCDIPSFRSWRICRLRSGIGIVVYTLAVTIVCVSGLSAAGKHHHLEHPSA